MKINLALIISIILSVGLVAFGFTAVQISSERQQLRQELAITTISGANEYFSRFLDRPKRPREIITTGISDSLANTYGFQGIVLYYHHDSILPVNEKLKGLVSHSLDHLSRAVSSDSSMGNYIRQDGNSIYEYIRIVKEENLSFKAVIFYANAGYIENSMNNIWISSFIKWFLQALLISGVTLLIIRRSIFLPVTKVVEWLKATRLGQAEKITAKPDIEFLQPLYKEITGIAQAMQEAKAVAQEEARLRTTSEAVWTPERLNEEMKQVLENKMLIVVSNREPYMHVHRGNEIEILVPASGMVTAMESILKACGGLWVASGSGDADREMVDKDDKMMVPPGENKYTLRRVWLTKEQELHYYYGFSNEGLWPLCHIAHTRPVFRKIDWDYYKEVNELYAKAILTEITEMESPFILVQDYHFALLPMLIKQVRPDARVAIFWHIPWPNPESFGICPWKREILTGMLGADLIGFHTQFHCNNFLETVNNSIESRVIWENFSVKIGNHFTLVKPFPISIAFTSIGQEPALETAPRTAISELLKRHSLQADFVGIGVDRIDYTKGLVEKFLAVERFLEKNSFYVGSFTFVQIGAPSRALLKTYSDTIMGVEQEAIRINARFKTRSWQPILFLKSHHSHEEILPLYQSANFCMVTSLHDGMNLVAKEFIASRNDNDGVLILSQFAGASHELHGALVINPYDQEGSADAIRTALEMPKELQTQKMKQMRRVILKHNIYRWGASILRTMASIEN